MSLVEKVALRHFEHSPEGKLSEAEKVKLREVQELNALPLGEFQELPQRMQEFAEDLWTARVVDANLRRQAERRALIEQDLALGPNDQDRPPLHYSWRE